MRNLYLGLALVVFGFPLTSHAAPICVSGTLAEYQTLGATGCLLGPATVADFTSTAVLLGATPITAADVLVIPRPAIFALDFGVTQSAAASELFDILIRYSVSGASVGENTLAMTGTAAAGDGNVTAVESKCVGGSFAGSDPLGSACLGTAVSLIVAQDALGLISPESAVFPPGSFLDVFTEITVDGGTNGSASLNGFVRNAFAVTSVPEPAVLVLMSLGVAGIAARRRSRR